MMRSKLRWFALSFVFVAGFGQAQQLTLDERRAQQVGATVAYAKKYSFHPASIGSSQLTCDNAVTPCLIPVYVFAPGKGPLSPGDDAAKCTVYLQVAAIWAKVGARIVWQLVPANPYQDVSFYRFSTRNHGIEIPGYVASGEFSDPGPERYLSEPRPSIDRFGWTARKETPSFSFPNLPGFPSTGVPFKFPRPYNISVERGTVDAATGELTWNDCNPGDPVIVNQN